MNTKVISYPYDVNFYTNINNSILAYTPVFENIEHTIEYRIVLVCNNFSYINKKVYLQYGYYLFMRNKDGSQITPDNPNFVQSNFSYTLSWQDNDGSNNQQVYKGTQFLCVAPVENINCTIENNVYNYAIDLNYYAGPLDVKFNNVVQDYYFFKELDHTYLKTNDITINCNISFNAGSSIYKEFDRNVESDSIIVIQKNVSPVINMQSFSNIRYNKASIGTNVGEIEAFLSCDKTIIETFTFLGNFLYTIDNTPHFSLSFPSDDGMVLFGSWLYNNTDYVLTFRILDYLDPVYPSTEPEIYELSSWELVFKIDPNNPITLYDREVPLELYITSEARIFYNNENSYIMKARSSLEGTSLIQLDTNRYFHTWRYNIQEYDEQPNIFPYFCRLLIVDTEPSIEDSKYIYKYNGDYYQWRNGEFITLNDYNPLTDILFIDKPNTNNDLNIYVEDQNIDGSNKKTSSSLDYIPLRYLTPGILPNLSNFNIIKTSIDPISRKYIVNPQCTIQYDTNDSLDHVRLHCLGSKCNEYSEELDYTFSSSEWLNSPSILLSQDTKYDVNSITLEIYTTKRGDIPATITNSVDIIQYIDILNHENEQIQSINYKTTPVYIKENAKGKFINGVSTVNRNNDRYISSYDYKINDGDWYLNEGETYTFKNLNIDTPYTIQTKINVHYAVGDSNGVKDFYIIRRDENIKTEKGIPQCRIKTDNGWKFGTAYIKTDDGWKKGSLIFTKTNSGWECSKYEEFGEQD